ncbi:hypothetical protein G4B88_027595 [Cannabis sativa]|uniref:Uncharacterized protein n=1 Tax=Cannabis sativa TaxID=3483 RepID=A0A7J6HR36_CANSA|nr:hypothetical protein G4B88_027595 [Cannabis sativa]
MGKPCRMPIRAKFNHQWDDTVALDFLPSKGIPYEGWLFHLRFNPLVEQSDQVVSLLILAVLAMLDGLEDPSFPCVRSFNSRLDSGSCRRLVSWMDLYGSGVDWLARTWCVVDDLESSRRPMGKVQLLEHNTCIDRPTIFGGCPVYGMSRLAGQLEVRSFYGFSSLLLSLHTLHVRRAVVVLQLRGPDRGHARSDQAGTHGLPAPAATSSPLAFLRRNRQAPPTRRLLVFHSIAREGLLQ